MDMHAYSQLKVYILYALLPTMPMTFGSLPRHPTPSQHHGPHNLWTELRGMACLNCTVHVVEQHVQVAQEVSRLEDEELGHDGVYHGIGRDDVAHHFCM